MTTPTDLAQALREIIDADMQPVCCNRPERHPDTGEPLGCCGSPEPEPGPCAQIAIAALAAHESRAQPANTQQCPDPAGCLREGCNQHGDGSLCDRFVEPTQPASVPKGYALVPERMHLDADTLAAIGFVAGGASDDDARAEEPKAWSEAILWVGNIVGDDGKETYGLNVANAEYPEEGSAQLVEFEQPRPAQPASVAAAEQLCKIYFEIAAECIGEEDVRRRRDERIAMLAATAPQPAKET